MAPIAKWYGADACGPHIMRLRACGVGGRIARRLFLAVVYIARIRALGGHHSSYDR